MSDDESDDEFVLYEVVSESEAPQSKSDSLRFDGLLNLIRSSEDSLRTLLDKAQCTYDQMTPAAANIEQGVYLQCYMLKAKEVVEGLHGLLGAAVETCVNACVVTESCGK
eukprot:s297_g3.t1